MYFVGRLAFANNQPGVCQQWTIAIHLVSNHLDFFANLEPCTMAGVTDVI